LSPASTCWESSPGGPLLLGKDIDVGLSIAIRLSCERASNGALCRELREKTYYTLCVLSTLGASHFLAAGAWFGPPKTTSITGPVGLRRWVGFFNAMVILLPLRRALAPLHAVGPTDQRAPSVQRPRRRSRPRSRWEQGEQLAYGPTPMGDPSPRENRPPGCQAVRNTRQISDAREEKGPKHLGAVEGFGLSFEVAAVEFRGNSVRPA
jgi:hypothetical protein